MILKLCLEFAVLNLFSFRHVLTKRTKTNFCVILKPFWFSQYKNWKGTQVWLLQPLWVAVGGAQVAIISKHPPVTEGSRHLIAVYHAEGLVTPTLSSCVMSDLCLFRCLLNLDLQLLCLFTLIAQLACLDLFALVCLPWTSIGPAVLLPLNIKTINPLSASASLSTTCAQNQPIG